jgi:hypothetical protein
VSASPGLTRVRWIAGGVMLVALGVALWAWRVQPLKVGESEVIVEPWDRLGGARWLKPGLAEARVVVPDRPHDHGEVLQARRGGASTIRRVRAFTVSTNGLRLRGPELGPKAAGRTRVVALGDSVTHGWGVPEEASYPRRLEATLRARGHDVEVINAGVPANPIGTMRTWCRAIAPGLQPDLLLWTRRPEGNDPPPHAGYVAAVLDCAAAIGVPVVAVLPPIASFDPHGREVWQAEGAALEAALTPRGVRVVELTPALDAARGNRGEVLAWRDGAWAVVDQETGRVWRTAPRSPRPGVPPTLLALFEEEPSVREALFFDDGHPDEEGFRVFAEALADAIEPRLRPAGAPPAR